MIEELARNFHNNLFSLLVFKFAVQENGSDQGLKDITQKFKSVNF